MTFDEFIQDGLGKADKLFGKLAQTGPNAVKTRERLFLSLKAELNHLHRFERNHLLPALGDEEKTRPLVEALEKDSEAVTALLAEIASTPPNGDGFLLKLAELQHAFQAHVRDERKELLPAVLEALQKAREAELGAADSDAANEGSADLHVAEVKAEELKTAQVQSPNHAESPALAEAVAVAEPLSTSIQAPLASPTAPTMQPSPRAIPPSMPAYGLQAWTNLMQEAAAGALMGYRLMLAYSNNTDLAALQARLMRERIELMTKSSRKMIEAAERLTKAAGRA